MTENELYKKAVEKWGIQSQVGMAMEECAELIQVLHKVFFRSIGCLHRHGVAEEIADVEIMCAQLRIIIGNNSVDEWKEFKLKKLERRIDE